MEDKIIMISDFESIDISNSKNIVKLLLNNQKNISFFRNWLFNDITISRNLIIGNEEGYFYGFGHCRVFSVSYNIDDYSKQVEIKIVFDKLLDSSNVLYRKLTRIQKINDFINSQDPLLCSEQKIS